MMLWSRIGFLVRRYRALRKTWYVGLKGGKLSRRECLRRAFQDAGYVTRRAA